MENIKELNNNFIALIKENESLKEKKEQLEKEYDKVEENYQYLKTKLKNHYLLQENLRQEREWLIEKMNEQNKKIIF